MGCVASHQVMHYTSAWPSVSYQAQVSRALLAGPACLAGHVPGALVGSVVVRLAVHAKIQHQ
jgi:hypothetical protein